MQLFDKIKTEIVNVTHRSYGTSIDPGLLTVSPTRKDFEGDMTVVIFPLVKLLRKKPQDIGAIIGDHLVSKMPEIDHFNVVQGFVNLSLTSDYWLSFLEKSLAHDEYGKLARNGEKVMIEYSSPNTNKPLHLGHIRNILLGSSCANIMHAAGFEVVKVQVINDRGIAICKSMLAWLKYGGGETPASTGEKGDHLVGKYYVRFEKEFRDEYQEWQQSPKAQEVFESRKKEDQSRDQFFAAYKNEYFNRYSELGNEAREMLQKWEDGDADTIELWSQMNGWVYAGFDQTYERLGVDFDHLYYESETWKLGKSEVLQGLDKNLFFQKDDGSVWVDLSHEDKDEKILLRSDGTSVYITQDIGTAMQRYRDYGIDRMVYVVADEQNYHFQVLFEILNMLDEPYAEGLFHLSYGMVDLPSGKMKSREGTVVDADDLIDDVISEARQVAMEKGDLEDLDESARDEVFFRIGMGALKFFILKVNPGKRMTFDPEASVDMQGQTGPYVQNAYVRIQSVLRKAGSISADFRSCQSFGDTEKHLLTQIFMYPEIVKRSANEYDPSVIANFCYDLAKSYHRFYHDVPILTAESDAARNFRLSLSSMVGTVLENGMNLLGIEMPQRM